MQHSGGQDNLLQKWLDFTHKLYSTLEVEKAAQIIIRTSLELTGMTRGSLFLFDEQQEPAFRCGAENSGLPLSASDFHIDSAWINDCITGDEAVYVHTSPGTSETSPRLLAYCIPICAAPPSGDVMKRIGILYGEADRAIYFSDEEKEILKVIATHAGPALENAVIFEMATRDPATNLYQRHYFESMAAVEWRRTVRHKHPLSVMVAQLEDLREFREVYGATPATRAVEKIAEIMRGACRTADSVSRYSENQFSMLLPETNQAGAKRVARRIQEQMEKQFAAEPEPVLTLYIGVANYPKCTVTSILELFQLAGIALRQSQKAGAARTIAYEPSLHHAHKQLFS